MPLSTVTDIFAAADDHLNNTLFGEEVTYTPADGSDASIFDMRIDRGVNLGQDTNIQNRNIGKKDSQAFHATGFILVSDISLPVYKDKISATGPGGNAETWWMMYLLASDSSTHTVALRSGLKAPMRL